MKTELQELKDIEHQISKIEEATQRRIMDFAASTLEKTLILYKDELQEPYRRRIRSAVKLLRNPPTKNKGMRG